PGSGWSLPRIQACLGGVEGGEVSKAVVTITQIEIIGIRLARVSLIKDGVEALRLRHIQRAQNEGIEDAEYHCVGADGQSEREHCRKGKPRRAAQLAEGIAEIE